MAINVGTAVAYLELDTSKFSGGFKSALSDLNTFVDKTSSVSTKIGALSSAFSTAGSAMTKSLTVPIAGLAGAGVKTAAQFESSMSQVAATMGMTADEIRNGSEDYAKLEKAARDSGKATKYSASEAAEALNYLALAGKSVDESTELLPKILNLAAAGNMELATASDMVTDAMSALGLATKDADSFIDKMAKASQKSNTSVAQLGEGILTVGGTARNLAGGTTELNTALGILADNGVKGAEGGTALRNVILSLTAPTDTAKKKMKELGLEVFDADGNMRPLNDTFNDLNSILSGMTQGQQTEVLNEIFNKVDLKSVNALLANSGDRFNELSGYIDDSAGAAQNMADTMQENLQGQLTKLKSALEEAGISLGKALLPTLKKAVTFVNNLTDAFNNLSDEQKQQVVKYGLIAAAIGPVLLIISKLVGAVSTIVSAFGKLKGIGAVFSGISAPIVAVIAVIGVLVGSFIYLWKTSEDFRDKVTAVLDGVKEKFEYFQSALSEKLGKIGITMDDVKNGIAKAWDVIANVIASPILTNALEYVSDMFGDVLDVILDFVDAIVAAMNGDWSGVKDGLGSAIQDIYKMFRELPSHIISLIGDLGSSILKAFGLDEEAEAFGRFFDGLQIGFDTITDIVGSILKPAFEVVLDMIAGVVNNIGTLFTKITNAGKDISGIFDSIVNGDIGGAFENLFNLIGNTLSLIPDLISNALSTIGDIGATILSALGFDEAAAKFEEFFDTLSGFFGNIGEFMENFGTNMATFFTETIPAAFDTFVSFIGDLVTSIGDAISGFFTETIPNAWNTFVTETLPAIGEYIAGIPAKIAELLGYILGSIVGFLVSLPGTIMDALTSLWETITTWLDTAVMFIENLPDTIMSILSNLWNSLTTWFGDLGEKSAEAGQNFVDSFVEWITGLPARIKNKFDEIITAIGQWGTDMRNKMNEKIDGLISDLKSVNLLEVGKSIMKSLWNGLKDTWKSVNKWFNNIWKSFKSGFTSGFEDTSSLSTTALSIDGSHRNGLSYVPWDGYTARLHKGERVLTKEQNEEYNKGDGSSGGDTFVFYNTKPDPYEYSRQMKRSKRELSHNL